MTLCCEIFFFLSCNQALSASKKKPETPTRIRSDIMDIKRKSQIIDFLGNVVVEKDDSSLLAQKMRVVYEEQKTGNKNSNATEKKSAIKRIDASENVKIFSEDFIASGDIGYYEPQQNTFTLEKNVIVNNGTSIGSGDKFIYNLKTKKGNFVGRKDETSITGNGGDKRVIVIIGDDVKSMKQNKKESKKQDEQNLKR